MTTEPSYRVTCDLCGKRQHADYDGVPYWHRVTTSRFDKRWFAADEREIDVCETCFKTRVEPTLTVASEGEAS